MGASGDARPAPGERRRVVAGLLVILAVAMVARIPTMRLPLDQDCAVYSYAAQSWLGGGLPYRDAWDHKPPLIYLAYAALFSVAPASPLTLRVASALCDGLTLVLVFLLASRVFRPAVGLWAAALYGLFTAGPGLQREAFQPEHLMTLFVTGAMLAAWAYAEGRRYRYAALCGLLFGLALAAKQTAAPLGVFVWAWLTWEAAWREGRAALRRIAAHSALLAVGAVLPWALFAAYFAARGAFADFWFCTYVYNAHYATAERRAGLPGSVLLLFRTKVFQHDFLWATAGAALLAAVARTAWRRRGIVVGAWAAAAFVGVYLPGQFASYYYIQTIPPLAIASGFALAGLSGEGREGGWRSASVVLAGAVLLGLLGLAAKHEWALYREAADPANTDRVVEQIGRSLRLRTKPSARLYVWGSRPQVYFFAQRKDACRYLFNFSFRGPLEKAFHFRREQLAEIMAGLREHKPPFIVATETKTLSGFPELERFLAEQYVLDREWPGKPYAPKVFRRREGS